MRISNVGLALVKALNETQHQNVVALEDTTGKTRDEIEALRNERGRLRWLAPQVRRRQQDR